MNAPMKPDDAPAAPPAEGGAPAAPKGGGAREIVSGIHTGLMELMDMMGQSSAVDDDDKAKLGSLIQGFQEFVEGLGSAPGAAPKGAKPGAGVAPAMAGAAEVKPAL